MSYFFFFQAEDGIRDKLVTGVQTCALPISVRKEPAGSAAASSAWTEPKTWRAEGDGEEKVQGPKSKVQGIQSKTQNQESKIDSCRLRGSRPESRVPSLASRPVRVHQREGRHPRVPPEGERTSAASVPEPDRAGRDIRRRLLRGQPQRSGRLYRRDTLARASDVQGDAALQPREGDGDRGGTRGPGSALQRHDVVRPDELLRDPSLGAPGGGGPDRGLAHARVSHPGRGPAAGDDGRPQRVRTR